MTGEAARMYARHPMRPASNDDSLGNYYRAEARETLRHGYETGDRDPRLLASLGLCECDAGHAEKGRAFLEAAAEASVVRPRVYIELARLRYREALAQPKGPGGKLAADQTASVLAPLVLARRQTPRLPQVYEIIVDAWMESAAKPGKEDFAPIEEALRLYPRDTTLSYKVARLLVSCGLEREARAEIERCLLFRPAPEIADRFEKIRSEFKSAK